MASSEYISREAALESVREKVLICESLPDTIVKDASLFALASMNDSLESIPASDVRPVVTCGECKYWELSKIEPLYHVCTYLCGVTFVREAEDFCSRGEKMEESDD